MRKKLLAAGLAAALGAGITFNVMAQVKPEILVKQRQSAMTLIGKYFFPLAPMASGKAPYDAATFARNAGYLEVLAKMPWDGFDPSTANEKNTRALPEIYKDTAKFKAAADALQVETTKLAAATKTGNEATVKAAFGDVGKVCATCHDGFRAKQ